ncbi:polysaccharide deacetylase family protein [Virgibacillus doumboii]|uniref:polysaccharide deacetylase family protein n=1 Tax=Virgibacillus doumboii TaxID=2697503 RepID=UPI0013DFA04F|nr:polysaccharide deacetylase family protein [Virgibacillus doumboii]
MRQLKLLIIIFLLVFTAACDSEKTAEKSPENQIGLDTKEGPDQILDAGDVFNKAEQGLVPSSRFNAINSTIVEVKAEWGEPDRVDNAGEGMYATYAQRNITFGYNKSGQIFDVRSDAEDIQALTIGEVKNALGEPDEVTSYREDQIVAFNLNPIALKFIFRNGSENVHHISVINQEEAQSDYVLDIKGKSNQLSEEGWQNMKNWRKQIINFAQEQNHVYTNGPDKKMVALTFDDGPDDDITPAIVDILSDYNVTGNFFFEGRKVEQHPGIVEKAFEKGNLVLSHGFTHTDLTTMGKEQILSEIERTEKAIESAIGVKPAIIRTPYGETDERVALIAKNNGYSIVLWSIDTLDWSQKESQNIVNNVVDNIRNGDIILMHSNAGRTATKEALPAIIESLQGRNFEIVGLDEMLNIKAYQ